MGGGDANSGLRPAQEDALAATRFRVDWVGETGSTNDDVAAAARRGAPDGTVLVADHQTTGHGRRGRSWEAPARSSLLVSILLRPDVAPEDLHLLTTAVGVAAAEAITDELAVPVGLKWPNDLLGITSTGDERKLGGILAEGVWDGDRLDGVVVGLGLNVHWPHVVPVELDGIAVALNHLTDEPVDRGDLLVALLLRLEGIVQDLPGAGLQHRWNGLTMTVDRDVRVELADGEVVEGVARGITETGRLLVETDAGDVEEITAGDVHHLR
ncbi:MAG TPA: biotin--[acetyl-CoA-carboxylase] ligase [Acidimicrobiales bacterium]|nr:biotin--[acetyl-CoA-carboxylase] ligase [Acidimicrobiales bacterium]